VAKLLAISPKTLTVVEPLTELGEASPQPNNRQAAAMKIITNAFTRRGILER
jgi:hypothetical protein